MGQVKVLSLAGRGALGWAPVVSLILLAAGLGGCGADLSSAQARCEGDLDCSEGQRCHLGTGVCVVAGPDGALACPSGCGAAAPLAGQQDGVCAGSLQRCDPVGCVWREPDYGELVDHEGVETLCDGLDNDCDGRTDEPEGLTPPAEQAPCPTLGVCAGLVAASTQGRWACSWPPAYEQRETLCDGLDNDCDGETDEGLVPPPATKQHGVCAPARRVCAGAAGWQEPDYAALARYEQVERRCDGLDNDCDGRTDEELVAPLVDDAQGVCQGSRQVCGGAWGWRDPDYDELDAYEALETLCDGLDNDCDGQVDEDLEVPAAALCPVQGVCRWASPRCEGAGGWGCVLPPEWAAAELPCDGLDNDCDGALHPLERDADGDGVPACRGDCDDADPLVHPAMDAAPGWASAEGGASERWPEGLPEVAAPLDLCGDGRDFDCSAAGGDAVGGPAEAGAEEDRPTCPSPSVLLPDRPRGLFAHPDGGALYVSLEQYQDGATALARVRTDLPFGEAGHTELQRVDWGPERVRGVAFHPGGRRAYLVGLGSRYLFEVAVDVDGGTYDLETLSRPRYERLYSDTTGVYRVAYQGEDEETVWLYLVGISALGPFAERFGVHTGALHDFEPLGAGPYRLARALGQPVLASASGGEDGAIELQTTAGERLHTTLAESPIGSLAVGEDAEGLIWAFAADALGRVHALPADRERPQLVVEAPAERPDVRFLAVAAQGPWLLVLRSDRLEVRSMPEGQLLRTVDLDPTLGAPEERPTYSVRGLAVAPAGREPLARVLATRNAEPRRAVLVEVR